ncbi:FAD-dependent oxidoreductase [Pseudarthrobacter sp. J75]|uniref:FAD-dependent oxidoreductase n=1 Tax=Pseudarthrobacter sp. J75 TaxID=3116486 RepID=UPI002E81D034|nr:FAD-dependent oxidoreductase [Pseudarthrobacter sp. J75]MEE2528802.1 FAD-dependent oxidoreductase [Pseudarthrobacter sp. J75]
MEPQVVETRSPLQVRQWNEVPAVQPRTYDAVVLGGGLASCGAALVIARAGFSVAILEETHMVGGQATAAGVSAFDITFRYDEAINDHGLWGEIVDRLMRVYRDELRRPLNVGHYNDVSITPNVVVVERVLTEMLEEAGVEVLRNTSVESVEFDGADFREVATSAGRIMAQLVLDGTELGLVAEQARAARFVGNELVAGGKAASSQSRIQDITYTCTIRLYPEGIPSDLRITTPPPGYEKYAEDFRVHFPPDGVTDPQLRKQGPVGFAGYRAAPDLASDNSWVGSDWHAVTRTNLNYRNDTHTSAAYLYDPSVRDETDRAALYATLSIIYYLQNELSSNWAPCTDEGYADGPDHPALRLVSPEYHSVVRHFPLTPYIRESVRIAGVQTLTGKHIKRSINGQIALWNVHSIATGTYPPDLHGGREPRDFESHLEETIADKPARWREGPFSIPLGCLVPVELDGYIALEKNISASRIAAAACRLHPSAVGIGQAGGTLAVASLVRGVAPRQVPPAIVQWLLARAGALITPLSIAGVSPREQRYAAIAFAMARAKVPWTVGKSATGEQCMVADLSEAEKGGSGAQDYVKLWLGAKTSQREGLCAWIDGERADAPNVG